MLKKLFRFIDAFIPAKVQANPDLHIRGQMLVESALLVVPMCSIYFIVYIILGHPVGAGVSAFGATMAVVALWDFRRRGNLNFTGNIFTLVSFIVIGSLTLSTYGINTLMAPWILMVAVSGFLLVGIRAGMYWSLLCVLFILSLFLIDIYQVPLPTYMDAKYIPVINFASLTGLVGYIVLTLVNNELGRQRIYKDLRKVKEDVVQKNQQITSINQALESTVQKRTQGLIAANEELDTFLYESSHALRRPLVRIIGLMNILKSNISEEEHERFMGLIDYTAVNMDTMLKDLIVVSDVYQHAIKHETIEIEAEIDRILDRMEVNRQSIKVEINSNLNLETDSELLEIMLQKVIDNALFFKREDAGHQVTIRAFAEAGQNIIEIEDNGMGIDPAAQPDLFKMFSRGTEKSRGSGLGLFIVRKIIDRLEGKVDIVSQLGSFTRIRMEL